ncbi:MAG: hypothetical protein ACK4ZJ_18000, partial [Allorhizobium sp.]
VCAEAKASTAQLWVELCRLHRAHYELRPLGLSSQQARSRNLRLVRDVVRCMQWARRAGARSDGHVPPMLRGDAPPDDPAVATAPSNSWLASYPRAVQACVGLLTGGAAGASGGGSASAMSELVSSAATTPSATTPSAAAAVASEAPPLAEALGRMQGALFVLSLGSDLLLSYAPLLGTPLVQRMLPPRPHRLELPALAHAMAAGNAGTQRSRSQGGARGDSSPGSGRSGHAEGS